MLQKIKKVFAVLTILVLLPYIITVFIHGKGVNPIATEKESGEKDLKSQGVAELAGQVSSDYEEEMLKVQAIIVRTTLYREISQKGENQGGTAETEEKATEGYSSAEQKNSSKEEKTTQAEQRGKKIDAALRRKLEKIWDDTEGKILVYNNQPALLPFHQVSNGKTRSGNEVLGNEEYPYLQSKECPADVEADNQMESRFIPVKGALVASVDSAGYVLTVKVGDEIVTGEQFRRTYNLPSGCFELQEFSENTRVLTKGVGHGLGLSQYTANEMAKNGKTYGEILNFFFEGTEIREVAEILHNIE